MALANAIATAGQILGLPEMKISEKFANSPTQTVPGYTGGGILGSGGYVRSPVPGGTSVYNVSGGKYTEGPFKGQSQQQVLGTSTSSKQSQPGYDFGYSGSLPPPQQKVPSDFGGGGSGADISVGNQTWSSQEDYDKESAYARSLGYRDAADMRAQEGSLVEEAYSGAMGVYDDALRQINENYPQEEQNLLSGVEGEIGKANTQKEQLLGDVSDQQTSFNKQMESALQQAYRALSALNQQTRSRFGLGSSAGGAVGELAQQEFFRNQGNIQEQQAQGSLAFGKEMGRVKTYVSQKIDDLNQFKNEALLSLKQNMQDRINEINARKGDIQANKAKDKLAIMQDAMNRIRYVADQDKQFRQNLGMAAISQMQEISGRSFSPKEIKATLADFGVNISGLNSGFSTPTVTGRPGVNNNDEFQGLL